MQRLGRWVLPFLVFVTVVGTAVLTAVPLYADELKQEETVTELITQEEMKEQIKEELGSEIGLEVDTKIDEKIDEKVRAEIDSMQQHRIPFFLKLLGCTVVSSAVGACTAILFYSISQTEVESSPSEKKIEYKDEQSAKEEGAEDFEKIDLDYQLITEIKEDKEEQRKKNQKLEMRHVEEIEEESNWLEEKEPIHQNQLAEVSPMVELLYRNRVESPALVKQMQGYNLNSPLLMEQLMRNDGSPVVIYLQECNDRKPLFIVDHSADLWINPIFTNLNEQGIIDISSMWYDQARIKHVFEICSMDYRILPKLPQGRIKIAEIVPAEIEVSGDQAYVKKKGYLKILN